MLSLSTTAVSENGFDVAKEIQSLRLFVNATALMQTVHIEIVVLCESTTFSESIG